MAVGWLGFTSEGRHLWSIRNRRVYPGMGLLLGLFIFFLLVKLRDVAHDLVKFVPLPISIPMKVWHLTPISNRMA